MTADFLMNTFVDGENNELEKLFNPFDPGYVPQKATGKFLGLSGIFGWAPKESATPATAAHRFQKAQVDSTGSLNNTFVANSSRSLRNWPSFWSKSQS